MPFSTKEDFDQIQWPKKEDYQQLLNKYKDKEVGAVRLLKKGEDNILIQSVPTRSFHSRVPPSSLKTVHQGCSRNNQVQNQGLQRGIHSMDVGHKEGRSH
jgi:hypothetical protein